MIEVTNEPGANMQCRRQKIPIPLHTFKFDILLQLAAGFFIKIFIKIFLTINATYVTLITRVTKINYEEVKTMKKITRKIEDLFIDVTFAEDREYMAMRGIEGSLEDMFVAIAFAEEGETKDIKRPRKPVKAITLNPATV